MLSVILNLWVSAPKLSRARRQAVAKYTPLVTVGLVFLHGVFELTFKSFQLRYKVVIGFDLDLLRVVLGDHVLKFSVALFIALQAFL
jgi:hypothetical protein